MPDLAAPALRLGVAEEVAQLGHMKGDAGSLQLAFGQRLEVPGNIFEGGLFQWLTLLVDPVQECSDALLVVMKRAW
jgi:hypothetical protein